MATYNNILEAIGRTPLIRLNNIAQDIQSPLYAKVEFLNPGGSTKDRIALAMVEAAEKQGLLRPGGTIVEATAGNTGVGLALISAVKKYRCIFVMPDKMSQDKINLLKGYGAEVVITPTSVPPDSPESYNGVAERLAKEIPGAYRPHQFENPNNPLAHYLTTEPEIWAFSDSWMQENGFWEGKTVKSIRVGDILSQKMDFPSLVFVSPRDTLSQANNLLQKLNISQLPVIDNNTVVGSLNEASLMKLIHEGINFNNQEVSVVMGKPLPILDEKVDVSEAYRLLLSGTTGMIIKQKELPIGLITRADLIKYWISQTEEKSRG